MKFRNTETDNILEVESAFIINQMKDNPKYEEIKENAKSTGEETKTVAMIKAELEALKVEIPKNANKATLQKLLDYTLLAKKSEEEGASRATGEETKTGAEAGQIGEI